MYSTVGYDKGMVNFNNFGDLEMIKTGTLLELKRILFTNGLYWPGEYYQIFNFVDTWCSILYQPVYIRMKDCDLNSNVKVLKDLFDALLSSLFSRDMLFD
jgi:hypothetical protein